MPERERRQTQSPKRIGGPERRKALIQKRKRDLKKIQRDTIIVTFTLSMAVYEITIGGARPSVFTFLGGLLISPLVLRYEDSRREASDE
jgi:hypothetical protein